MKRILVIDDEPAIRNNLAQLLTFEGFQVAEAGSGEDGLVQARALPPDLILCDLVMPRLDGYGLLKALREDARLAGIPFIFLTASAGEGEKALALASGAARFFTKPFQAAELLAAIRAAIGAAGTA